MEETEAFLEYDEARDEIDSIKSSNSDGLPKIHKTFQTRLKSENEGARVLERNKLAQSNANTKAKGNNRVVSTSLESNATRYNKAESPKQKMKISHGRIYISTLFRKTKGGPKLTTSTPGVDLTFASPNPMTREKNENNSLTENVNEGVDNNDVEVSRKSISTNVNPEPPHSINNSSVETLSNPSKPIAPFAEKNSAWKFQMAKAKTLPHKKPARRKVPQESRTQSKTNESLHTKTKPRIQRMSSRETENETSDHIIKIPKGNMAENNETAHRTLGQVILTPSGDEYAKYKTDRMNSGDTMESQKEMLRNEQLPSGSWSPALQQSLIAKPEAVDSHDDVESRQKSLKKVNKVTKAEIDSTTHNSIESKYSKIINNENLKRRSAARISYGRAATDSRNIQTCGVCKIDINLISTPPFERFTDSAQNYYHKACLRCEVCNISLGTSFQKSKTGDMIRVFCNNHFLSMKQSVVAMGIKGENSQMTHSQSAKAAVVKEQSSALNVQAKDNSRKHDYTSESDSLSKVEKDQRQKQRVSDTRISYGRAATDSKNIKPCSVCKKNINLISTPPFERFTDSSQNYYHKTCLKCEVCNVSLGTNFQKLNSGDKLTILCNHHFALLRNFGARTLPQEDKGELKSMDALLKIAEVKSQSSVRVVPSKDDPTGDDITDAPVSPSHATTVEKNQSEVKASKLMQMRKNKRVSGTRISYGRVATDSSNIKPCGVCKVNINLITTPPFERFADSRQNYYHKACLRCEVCNISLDANFQKLKTTDKLRVFCNNHFASVATAGNKVDSNTIKRADSLSKVENSKDESAREKAPPKYNAMEKSNVKEAMSLSKDVIADKGQSEVNVSKVLKTRQKRISGGRISYGRAATDSSKIKPCEICRKDINLISTPAFERYKDYKQRHYHTECLKCEVCKKYLGGSFYTLETRDKLRYLCRSHYLQLKQLATGIEVMKGTDKESMEHRESAARSISRGHLNWAKDEIGDDLEIMLDTMYPLCLKCGLELDSLVDPLVLLSHGKTQTHDECPSPEEVAQQKLGNIRLIVRKLPKVIPVKFHFNNHQVRTYFFTLDTESFQLALKQEAKENTKITYVAETEEDVRKRRSVKLPVRYREDDGISPAFRAELRGDLARITKGSRLETFYVRSKDETEEYLTAKGTVEQGLIYTAFATVSHNLKNGFVFPAQLELEIYRAEI